VSGTETTYRSDYIPPSLNLGNAATEMFFLNSLGKTAFVRLYTDGQFRNKRFVVNAAGRVVTSSNLTFTINLYLGTTGTPADTLIFSSGALTCNAKKSNWFVDLNCFWDGDSQLINGSGFGQLDNQQIGAGGLTNVPKLDPSLHNSSNSFQGVTYMITVSGTFSGSSAGNGAFLDVLEITLQ
jgi:hypothetical protein